MLSIVLARQDWREQDQIITFYTLEHGKKEVLARGVKKLLSKNSAFIEPGSLVKAEIISGKEWAQLGSVEPVDVLVVVRKNISNLALLNWSLKLIKHLIHEGEKDEQMFKLIFGWTKFLDTVIIQKDVVLLADIFACRLFRLLGFDIARDEAVEQTIRNDLNMVLKKDWEKLSALELEKKNRQTLHNIIFKFAQFHSEKKLENWAKLVYFSQK